MANTSDGDKGDPPDPSKANINTDALSISPPAAHSAKNVLILTGIDPDIKFFVHIDDDDEDAALNSPILTTPNPPKTTGTVSTTTTSVSTNLPISHANNIPISSRTEPVLTQKDHVSPTSSNTSPPADSDRPDSINRNSFNAPTTNASNDKADDCPANSWTKVLFRYQRWHGPVLGVPKSVPARTDFEKFVRIFPLLTRVIVWDSSTVECQFYG